MPLSKIQLKPGINKEVTSYANEGGYFACDKIRFYAGFPQKLGGWQNYSTLSAFKGVARALLNWVSFSSENLLGVGTNQKYYVENGGIYHDITPLNTTVTLGTDPFATTSGSLVVTVTHTGHGIVVGTFVTFSGASTVGGLTLNAEYEIVSVIDANSYTIASTTAASSTATGGGAAVSAAYQINAGNSVVTFGLGYGAGPYGLGGYGSAASSGVLQPMRVWSHDTFEENLILNTRGGPLYYWTKDTSGTPARAVLLSTSANALTKTTTTATFAGGVTTITVADPSFVTSGAVISGTGITAGTYVTEAYTGGTSVPISAVTTSGSSGSYTFSYAGRHVPGTVNTVITANAQHFTVVLGATPYDPTDFTTTFDPMLVRWSDQDNPFEWVPQTTNQAGEQRLANGSFLVTALNTKQELLLWSDSAVHAMQYVGPPFIWGFTLLNENCSIMSPNAAVEANGLVFWMGRGKFYQYNGRVETLNCDLQRFVFDNLNLSQADQVISGTNEGFNEVWWFYPSAESSVNDSYVIYNYDENLWYYGTMNRTAWLDSPLRDYPMAAYSVQNSFLSAAITSADTTLTLVNGNAYPASGTVTIDSEDITYTGVTGNSLTGCTRGANSTTAASHLAYAAVTMKIPNQIMYHEYGVDDGSLPTLTAIEAYIESSDFDLGDGHNYCFVWRILPDMDFLNSTAGSPTVLLTVKPRQNSGSAFDTAESPSVVRTATYPIDQYTGEVYTRVRGRQMRFRMESTALGTMWAMGAMRIDVRPDGRR